MPMSSDARWMLRPFGDEDIEQDYALIHRLANEAVPFDLKGNQIWVENRRRFASTGRKRRHYVAIDTSAQEPIAYAALEQQWEADPARFRLYLVFDPQRWTFGELGEFLYVQLLADARDLGVDVLAATEYARDVDFIDFLHDHGFAQVGDGTYNGHTIVMMESRL
jgi:hypothetical protein